MRIRGKKKKGRGERRENTVIRGKIWILLVLLKTGGRTSKISSSLVYWILCRRDEALGFRNESRQSLACSDVLLRTGSTYLWVFHILQSMC